MLAAYLDETGHSKDPDRKVVGFGALLASVEAWKGFDIRWKALCDDEEFRIKGAFHMTDFAAQRGHYKNWPEPKRQKFLQRVFEIVRETNPMPIGAIVSLADFNSLSEEQRSKFVDPYYIALQECAHNIGTTALLTGKPDINNPNLVHMTVSEHPEFKKAMELWDALRRYTLTGLFLHSCVCSRPDEVLPLQAADIWAYELGHHFQHIVPTQVTPRWPFRQFVEIAQANAVGSRFFTFFDRKELLQRLLGEF